MSPPIARSVLIASWNGMIINWIFVPSSDYSTKAGSFIDFFDTAGNLLSTLHLADPINVSYMDSNGKIYGTVLKQSNYQNYQKIVRYSLEYHH